MIKNERQYRITKAQAAGFANTLSKLEGDPASSLHPILRQAQIDAVKSQQTDLQAALRDYEALQKVRPAVIEAHSLEGLPRALIRARIALGLSQRDLAERMGLKEQQVQRYEASEYVSASLARIREVIGALGVHVAENVFLPAQELTRDALYTRLDSAGIDSGFLLGRLLPSDVAVRLESVPAESEGRWVASATEVLAHIFGWSAADFHASAPLVLEDAAVATARFKLPGGTHGRRLHAYIVYAHYLGMVVANACENLPNIPLTLDASALRNALVARDPEVGLETVLNFFWDQGVPVFPLDDAGAFHGACWRIAGRNVIAVKHRSRFLARWIFDLLHEWRHAAEAPEDASHSCIEDADFTSTRRTSPDEQAASRFAGDVVLAGRAEDLVAECITAAKGLIPALKRIVPKVAQQSAVGVDHLANYLAWRLSLQGENWWGAASNLQTQIGDPFAIARDVFYKRFDFSRITPLDARLLHKALQREGDPE